MINLWYPDDNDKGDAINSSELEEEIKEKRDNLRQLCRSFQEQLSSEYIDVEPEHFNVFSSWEKFRQICIRCFMKK